MAARARRGNGARTGEPATRACCLVSEVLEEAGLDRQTMRKVRRQVLEGIILLCRWQLDRMNTPRSSGEKEGRKVTVE